MEILDRIGVLAERRYLSQAQPAGLIAALRAGGHPVSVIDPDARAYELTDHGWLGELDLIVSRGRSWGLLTLLSWAEARGVPTVNRRQGIAAVHNKAEMSVMLATGHVPTPSTFIGTVKEIANRATSVHYPLILKPIFGDNCSGLRVVRGAEEMAAVSWPEPIAIAQHYLPSDGFDLKLYAIGQEIWAVRKPSPFDPPAGAQHAHLVQLTPACRDLAVRCGGIFGLELYGIDCIETSEGPLVIEVNEFPNYSAVPDADERLAEYVKRRARSEVCAP